MTRWAFLLVLLPGGLILLALLEYWRRWDAREHAADYVQAIQALKSKTPMKLPEVRALKDTVQRHPLVPIPEPKKAVTKLRRVG